MEGQTQRYRLHVYTGEGKGKTTAAVGLAVRMRGQGGSVLFAQCLKDGRSGELNALWRLGVRIFPMPICDGLFSRLSEADKMRFVQETEAAFGALIGEILGGADLVVLDELCVALSLGAVTEATARRCIQTALAAGETVVTGRNAPEWLLNMADYVTEMRAMRHPYQTEGLTARRGIEW